jgi:hypothetical protein
MPFTTKSTFSTQVLFQRMLALLAEVAARVLIWAREQQIMAERAEKMIASMKGSSKRPTSE